MGTISIFIIWIISFILTYPNTKISTWGSVKFGDYRNWVLFLLCFAIIMTLIILTGIVLLLG